MGQPQWVRKTSSQQPSGEIRNVEVRNTPYQKPVPVWSGPPGNQRLETRWVSETHTVYKYEVLEWHKCRVVTASGVDRHDVHWPKCALAPGERVRQRDETYSVTFDASPKQYKTTLDEAQWRMLTPGATYRLSLGRLGRVREVTSI